MENPKPTVSKTILGIIVVLSCLCLLVLGLGGYAVYSASKALSQSNLPDFLSVTETPVAQPVVTRLPTESITPDTLALLEKTDVPINDPAELACRLNGKCNVPKTPASPVAARVVGETGAFWASNVETNKNFQVKATLRYITPHVYFWVENGVKYDEGDLKTLADTFEQKIYPTDREFFGSEWTPGIDGDQHIYILYAGGLGGSIAGYFSSADEISPLIHEYSNGHEMFLFNSDNVGLGEDFTYGVLAHEFQHMIHWYQDRNETSWINEGFSVLASYLNHYNTGGFDKLYIANPDLQLNDWPNNHNATTPHYGAGFLYLTYFLDRFGEDATKKLVKDPANGFDGVDSVLREINATDHLTGKPIQADDFFIDWAVTNLINDPSAADGRFAYHDYPDASRVAATETINQCPQESFTRSVHQYGVDYIAIQCLGNYTLSFTGSNVTRLVPTDPYSGSYAFWSNKGDESDMTLTHEFDFTGVNGPITLSYQTWYDLEKDYDYVYLEVSKDGEHWQIITTPSGTPDDPTGSSYGWAYNGVTNGWVKEDVDLSQFAGQKVQVRFEYVTDAAVNGEGFLLDDVSIDAINYKSGFESDDGGWVANGFVRVKNVLPQTFRLALVLSDASSVHMTPINPDQTAEIPLSLKEGETAFLVISGTTRFTREQAAYQIQIK